MMQPKFLKSSLVDAFSLARRSITSANRRMLFFLFVAGLLASSSATAIELRQSAVGPGGNPFIEHFPVSFGVAGKPLVLEARVIAPGRSVIYVRVYFKSATQQAYQHRDLRPGPQGYVGQIPPAAVRPPVVQYFLVALLSDRTVINYPIKNAYGQPFEVAIQENTEKSSETARTPKSGAGAKPQPESSSRPSAEPPLEVSPQLLDKLQRLERPTAATPADTGSTLAVSPQTAMTADAEPIPPILVLSPEPFSSVAAKEAVIAASFAAANPVDSSSIQVLLDGQEVTSKAEVSTVMVSYTPAQIAPGEHTVTVTARDYFGQAIGPMSWRFKVEGKSGAVAEAQTKNRATGVAYAELRREKFGPTTLNNRNVGAELNGNTGPLNYSASAYFTSLEDKAFQPRNRFVLSAGLPWFNVTLGDATPYFDELVLWGRRVRGLQAGLHTGIINLDFVSGETVRSTAFTFKQTLLGLRPSFGSPNGFLLGFTLLKVRDDKNSIATGVTRVTPRDNLVIGTDVTLAFDRRRFQIKASGAWSLMTNDISQGPLSPDSLKKISDVDLPFDPKDFEDWFILNESTSPLDPTGKTSLAYLLSLQFNYFNQFITAGYKQIGSEYISFGQTFLRNDIRGFYVNDRFRTLRNRVHFTLGLERYDDHFNNIDGRPTTDLTTWQFGVSVFWDPNLPSLNLNLRNHSRDNGIDSLQVTNIGGTQFTSDNREDNSTQDLLVSLNYDVTAFNLDHTLTLSVMSSDRKDNFQRAIASGNVASNLKMISLRTRYQIPITSTLTYATNDNDIAGGQSLFKYNMFSARAEYDFSQKGFEQRGLQMRAYAGFSTVGASGGTSVTLLPTIGVINVIDYTQTGFQLGGSLQFKSNHEFVLDLNLVSYKDSGGTKTAAGTFITQNPSFNNSSIRAYYAFRF
jgi:hypothetical protein